MKPLLENIDPELENITKESTSNIPPWTYIPPHKKNFDSKKKKKNELQNSTLFRSNFIQIIEKYPNYQRVYMDGSKTNDAVAAESGGKECPCPVNTGLYLHNVHSNNYLPVVTNDSGYNNLLVLSTWVTNGAIPIIIKAS